MLCYNNNNIITLLTESGSVIMSSVICTDFNGLAVTDRADEINYGNSKMDTPVNCLEELTRSYSTGEMIAPSLPTKLYHFDKGIVFCKQHLL